jgi:hypothetical protein
MQSIKARLRALERMSSDAALFVVMRAGIGADVLLRERGIDPDASTVVVLQSYCEQAGKIVPDIGRPAEILSVSGVH